ncbi:MAG: sel1 repeat family protein [Clostridiales bacterium]|nr:sel1 repeat family protein [Clostridiales bacterium]
MIKLIILAIIIFLIVRYFKYRDTSWENMPPEKRLAAQKKEYEREMLFVRDGYGEIAIKSMWILATDFHGRKDGGLYDPQKASYWNQRALDVKLERKGYIDYDGPWPFGPGDQHVMFYLDGKYVPRNLDMAMTTAMKLFEAEEPQSAYMIEEIEELGRMGFQNVPCEHDAELAFFEPLANQGNHVALHWMALLTGTDDGTESFWSMKKAAEAGNYWADHSAEKADAIKKKYAYRRIKYLTEKLAEHYMKENGKKDFQEEMDRKGITGNLYETVEFLLDKAAGLSLAPAAETMDPPVPEEIFQVYEEARNMEREGRNFKKAAKLYEKPAAAGISEAQRRLGNLQRKVLSLYEGDEMFQSGTEWLGRAIQSGSILAQFDLSPEYADISAIGTMAASGNTEAMYALGMMMEKGFECKKNSVCAAMMFDLAWERIGDAVGTQNGEGMMLKLKIGRAEKRTDKDFYVYWAECAHRIGYAPGSFAMKDTYLFQQGGPDLMKTYLKAAKSAGYAKADAMYQAITREVDRWEETKKKELDDAANKRGIWAGSPRSPRELVNLVVENVNEKIEFYNTMVQMPGLPSYDWIKGNVPVESGEVSETELQEELQEEMQQETAEDCRLDDMPYFITDDWGREWTRDMDYGNTVRYIRQEFYSTVTGDFGDSWHGGEVYISQRHIEGNTAHLFGRTFHW